MITFLDRICLAVKNLGPFPVERAADAEALRHGLFIMAALAVGPGGAGPDRRRPVRGKGPMPVSLAKHDRRDEQDLVCAKKRDAIR